MRNYEYKKTIVNKETSNSWHSWHTEST